MSTPAIRQLALSDAEFDDTKNLFSQMKLTELKKMARALGLTLRGNKSDLMGRLNTHFDGGKEYGDGVRLLAMRTMALKVVNGVDIPDYNQLTQALKTGAFNYTNIPNQYSNNPPTSHRNTQSQSQPTEKPKKAPSSKFTGPVLLFKPSPFYTQKRLIRIDPNYVNPCVPKSQRSTFESSFVLTSEEQAILRSKPSMKLYFFSGMTTQSNSDIDVQWPPQLEIRCNGNVIKNSVKGFKNTVGTDSPADLTPLIHSGSKTNNIYMLYNGATEGFLTYLYIVETRKPEDILQTVLKHPHIHKSSTVSEIKKSYQDADGDDLVIAHSSLPLKCPLIYKRPNFPSKGIFCQHLQCFDCLSYLQLQATIPSWKCIICSRPLHLKDLAISDYLMEILQKTSEDVEQVDLKPDGSWEAIHEGDEDTQDKISNENKAASPNNVESVSNEPKKQLSPPSPIVIELLLETDDDDDDDRDAMAAPQTNNNFIPPVAEPNQLDAPAAAGIVTGLNDTTPRQTVPLTSHNDQMMDIGPNSNQDGTNSIHDEAPTSTHASNPISNNETQALPIPFSDSAILQGMAQDGTENESQAESNDNIPLAALNLADRTRPPSTRTSSTRPMSTELSSQTIASVSSYPTIASAQSNQTITSTTSDQTISSDHTISNVPLNQRNTSGPHTANNSNPSEPYKASENTIASVSSNQQVDSTMQSERSVASNSPEEIPLRIHESSRDTLRRSDGHNGASSLQQNQIPMVERQPTIPRSQSVSNFREANPHQDLLVQRSNTTPQNQHKQRGVQNVIEKSTLTGYGSSQPSSKETSNPNNQTFSNTNVHHQSTNINAVNSSSFNHVGNSHPAPVHTTSPPAMLPSDSNQFPNSIRTYGNNQYSDFPYGQAQAVSNNLREFEDFRKLEERAAQLSSTVSKYALELESTRQRMAFFKAQLEARKGSLPQNNPAPAMRSPTTYDQAYQTEYNRLLMRLEADHQRMLNEKARLQLTFEQMSRMGQVMSHPQQALVASSSNVSPNLFSNNIASRSFGPKALIENWKNIELGSIQWINKYEGWVPQDDTTRENYHTALQQVVQRLISVRAQLSSLNVPLVPIYRDTWLFKVMEPVSVQAKNRTNTLNESALLAQTQHSQTKNPQTPTASTTASSNSVSYNGQDSPVEHQPIQKQSLNGSLLSNHDTIRSEEASVNTDNGAINSGSHTLQNPNKTAEEGQSRPTALDQPPLENVSSLSSPQIVPALTNSQNRPMPVSTDSTAPLNSKNDKIPENRGLQIFAPHLREQERRKELLSRQKEDYNRMRENAFGRNRSSETIVSQAGSPSIADSTTVSLGADQISATPISYVTTNKDNSAPSVVTEAGSPSNNERMTAPEKRSQSNDVPPSVPSVMKTPNKPAASEDRSKISENEARYSQSAFDLMHNAINKQKASSKIKGMLNIEVYDNLVNSCDQSKVQATSVSPLNFKVSSMTLETPNSKKRSLSNPDKIDKVWNKRMNSDDNRSGANSSTASVRNDSTVANNENSNDQESEVPARAPNGNQDRRRSSDANTSSFGGGQTLDKTLARKMSNYKLKFDPKLIDQDEIIDLD